MADQVELVHGEPPMGRDDAEAIYWMVGAIVDVLKRDGWSREKTLRALEVVGAVAFDRTGYGLVQQVQAKGGA